MIAARFRQAFPVFFLLALMVLLARPRPAPAGSATRLWVTDVTPRSFSLVWTANQAATCFANVYADPEGDQLIQGLTITLESASYPPAEENGVMKVSISGLAPDTTYYFEIVTVSSEGVLVEPASGELQSVRTELSSVLVNNDLLAHKILQSDGINPAEGALLLAEVEGANYPITGWVGNGVPVPWALLELNNVYSYQSHMNKELIGGEEISLTSIGGSMGFRLLSAQVPLETGEIQTLDPEPHDGQCVLDSTGPVIDTRQLQPAADDLVNDNTPLITAAYSDRYSEIDPDSVRLLVDSMDVTEQATVDSTGIEYRPETPLTEGSHSVALTVADQWGNAADPFSWTFAVDVTALTATIAYSATSPTNQDVVATLETSEPVTITNNNGQATYSFTTNGSFTFAFVDSEGNTGSATATVSNIDRTSPTYLDYPSIDFINKTVEVVYSEDGMQNAMVEENYSFSPSLNFTTQGDGIVDLTAGTYRLAMASIPSYTIYTLTVSNITDRAGNPVSPATIKINDDDSDNMADDWESAKGVSDPNDDADGDGLANLGEFANGTEPGNSDSDDDGLPDGWEVQHNLDPNSESGINGPNGDPDGDSWTNHEEYINATDPYDDQSPLPTPTDFKQAIPHNSAGIDDSTRVPNNTSFAVRIEDPDGIDIDNDNIKFTVTVADNPLSYERFLITDQTVLRLVKLNPDDPNSRVSHLWVVYDRSRDALAGTTYPFDRIINITVDVTDRRLQTHQESYAFKIESSTEHDDAQANAPDTIPVDPADPDLGDETGEHYDAGIEVDSGDLDGAKIIYDSSEPVTPTFGPMDELPPLETNGVEAVGTPMNLQPPTVFNTPVKIFIPCPGYDDVSNLSVYFYNGTSWVPACDADGNVLSGGDGWMVPGSRVDHLQTNPPTIEIKVYHFSGAQAGASTSSPDPGTSESGGSEGSGGCFIATADFCSNRDRSAKILSEFRNNRLLTDSSGHRMVNLYYGFSSHAADYLRQHPVVRFPVKYGLIAITGMAYMALYVHPAALLCGLILLLLTGVYCARRL